MQDNGPLDDKTEACESTRVGTVRIGNCAMSAGVRCIRSMFDGAELTIRRKICSINVQGLIRVQTISLKVSPLCTYLQDGHNNLRRDLRGGAGTEYYLRLPWCGKH